MARAGVELRDASSDAGEVVAKRSGEASDRGRKRTKQTQTGGGRHSPGSGDSRRRVINSNNICFTRAKSGGGLGGMAGEGGEGEGLSNPGRLNRSVSGEPRLSGAPALHTLAVIFQAAAANSGANGRLGVNGRRVAEGWRFSWSIVEICRRSRRTS